jgi:serpin B
MAASEHDEAVDGATVDTLLARTKQRSSALRTRRRALLGGGSTAAIALVIALVVVTLPGGARAPAPLPLAPKGLVVSAQIDGAAEYSAPVAAAQPALGSSQEKSVTTAEQAFSARLLRQLQLLHGQDANEVVSPSSLAVALSMLELGAKGPTETQIAAALATAALSPDEQAVGWNALDADLASGATSGSLQLQQANALWSQEGLRLVPAFMREMRAEYGAGMWQVNFDSAAATAAINAWASQATHGKITQLFPLGPLGSSVALILANAIYFKGAWVNPFETTTENESFVTAGGQSVQAPYMFTGGDGVTVPWANTAGYEAVELPYKGGRFSALVVMPKNESLGALVSGLDPAALDRIVGSLHSSLVSVTMPTFQLSANLDLSSTLQAMGITAAFGAGANLTGLSNEGGLQVQSVIQKSFLHVTTGGTEAAAVTAIAVGSSAIAHRNSILVSHPFLFLIRDNKTGAILFAASVANPIG